MKNLVNDIRSVSVRKLQICMLVACAFAAGCTRTDTAPVLSEGEKVEIRQGTTANIGELRIGLGNVTRADYTNTAGEKKRGLVAVLWLFLGGNSPQEKRFDVYAGQRVRMDKYTVYVQQIRGGFTDSVTLQVKGR